MTSVTFRIHNADVKNPVRRCASVLTPGEEDQFIAQGFVIPAQPLPPAALTALTRAADTLAARVFSSPGEKTYQEDFPGQYIRDPHKTDPQILTRLLLDYPLAGTARSLLGPRVVLRNSNIRITRARSGDATIWHTDFRPHISPQPRLGAVPAVITALIYLDPADTQTGPLYVLPGSHHTPHQPPATMSALPGQAELVITPGQVVVMNAALWHRGGPNNSDRTRRLITVQLSSIFLPPHSFTATTPSVAYTRLAGQARDDGDEPLLELLGLGGIDPVSALY
ncbi:MAG TPA: phytanoyl-CoA dioxygenase family protein [Streptosporangiaceae bacterium]|nr:phytanoyl-CoA dioxygenase family protein [Streptosporangiaceae bacterium]